MTLAQLSLLKALCLAATAVALFTLAALAAATGSPDQTRLGLRGIKRQRALETVPFWSSVEPLVRWVGARFAGFLPASWRQSLHLRITLAGDYLGLLPEEALGLSLLGGLAGAAAGLLVGELAGFGGMLVIPGAFLGIALPYIQMSGVTNERQKRINRRLPYAIDLLALAMGAGLDFPGAVRQIVEKAAATDDPLVEEFTLILQSLQLGRTRSQALEGFAQRAPVDSVVEFVGSVIQAELRGNPVAEVLRIQAEVARRKRTVRAEELAAKAGMAMMGPLVLVFFSILILIMAPIVMRLAASASGM